MAKGSLISSLAIYAFGIFPIITGKEGQSSNLA